MWMIAFGLSFLPLLVPSDTWSAEKVSAKVIVKDVLAMPRQKIKLEARVVETGILGETGLGGINLEFFVDGVSQGPSMTGGDGRAFKVFTPPMRGVQKIRAKLLESRRVEVAEGTGKLLVWQRRQPILIVEFSALVEEVKQPFGLPGVSLPIGRGDLPDPLDGAAKHIGKLTKFYFNVVYLSRNGSVTHETLKAWLEEHKLPVGVARVIKPGKPALTAFLEEFAERGFDNIRAGVGRTRDLAETFAERRIKVVILTSNGDDRGYPTKTKWAKDWLEVRKQIQG